MAGSSQPDVIVVGSGPNGLAAAVTIARAGLSVKVLEAAPAIGGGARTEELTLPGFLHDVCSAIHPTAAVSPFFRGLGLDELGIELIDPPLPLVHSFEDGRAVALHQDIDEHAHHLGRDGVRWQRLMQPLLDHWKEFFSSTLRPVRLPQHPLLMARFAIDGLRSCVSLAKRFESEEARALFAGCAAHANVPLEGLGTASFGIILALAGHAVNWPLARGGSASIVRRLASRLESMGGEIETSHRVTSIGELDGARAVIFDLTPRQILEITGEHFPAGYRRALDRFRYGPGVFKMDWALDGPIPWRNPLCSRSATVHLGGSLEEIAAGERAVGKGAHPEKPFILLAQQSLFDDGRAPAGCHTGWAYCHVPHGSTADMSNVIETVVERHAPGFRDRILATHTIDSASLERRNANMVGGDIGGGANVLRQILARPVLRWDPYSTPDPRLFIGSSSTPPGGGVHGMGGWNAAERVLASVFGRRNPGGWS